MTRKTLATALAVFLALTSVASGNGFNLNGLGSRAQGMGGAFVGVADDFSAVFWNPAGAAGFRQTLFGFYAMDLMPRATYNQDGLLLGYPDIAAKTKTSHSLGFLAGYYKPLASKVVVGLGIGMPSVLGTMWNGSDFAALSDGTVYDWSSKVNVFSFSPLVAVRLSKAISLGAAVNVDYGTFNAKTWAGMSSYPASPPVDLGQYEENMNGWGVGATFGVLVKPLEKLSFGLTVRTPATISFDGAASMSNLPLYGLPRNSDLTRKITWPLWIAGGVSFRPTPRLLLSADVHWTQWSKLEQIQTFFLDGAWHALAAVEGRDLWILEWRDKTQVRFGAEYALNETTALRAGYYHDPSPSSAIRLSVLFPSHTFDAFSVGVGKTVGGLQLDFGLEYLAGNDRSYEFGFKTDTYGMRIVVPTASVSYKF